MTIEHFLKYRELSGNQQGFFIDRLLKTYGINPTAIHNTEDKRHLFHKYSTELKILKTKINHLYTQENAAEKINALLNIGGDEESFDSKKLFYLYKSSHIPKLAQDIRDMFDANTEENTELFETLEFIDQCSNVEADSQSEENILGASLFPISKICKILTDLFENKSENYNSARRIEELLSDTDELEDIKYLIDKLDSILEDESEMIVWQPYYLYQVTLNKLINIIQENKLDMSDYFSKLIRIAENTYNDQALNRIALLGRLQNRSGSHV